MTASGLRLSPWHMEIAKMFGEGKSNREIRERIQISDSRLSVLKHNPVFSREIEKWRKKHEEKYAKAMEVIAQSAEKVAQEMVNVATGVNTPFSVKAQVGNQLLDRLAQWEGADSSKGGAGEEITFEQLLRVTKKSVGSIGSEIVDEKSAYEELLNDIKPVEQYDLESEGENLEPVDSEQVEDNLYVREENPTSLASPALDFNDTNTTADRPGGSLVQSSSYQDSSTTKAPRPVPYMQALNAELRPDARTKVLGANGGAKKPYEISDELKQILGVH